MSLIFVTLTSILSCSDNKTSTKKGTSNENNKEKAKEKNKGEKKKNQSTLTKKKAKFEIIPLDPGVSVTRNSENFETINITLSIFSGNAVAKNKIYKDFLAKDVLKDVFAIKIKNTTGGIIRADTAKEKIYTEFSDFETPETICDEKGFCHETRDWEIEHTPTIGNVKLRTREVLTTVFIWITEGFGTVAADEHQYTPALVCYSSLQDHKKMFADGISTSEIPSIIGQKLTFRGGELLTCKIGFWSDNENAQGIPQKWIELAQNDSFFDVYFGGLQLGDFTSGPSPLMELGFSFAEITGGMNDAVFQEKVLQKISEQKEKFPTFIKKARIKLVLKLPKCDLPENSIIFEGS